MPKAILGTKLGMTQIFSPEGKIIPVTVVQAGPCRIAQVKTEEKRRLYRDPARLRRFEAGAGQ